LAGFYADSFIKMNDMMKTANAKEIELFNNINAIEEKTLAITARVIELRNNLQFNQATQVLMSEASPAYSEWLASINSFIDYQEAEINSSVGLVQKVASGFSMIMIIITLFALLLAMAFGWWLIQYFKKSLGAEPNELVRYAQLLSQGQLNQKFPQNRIKNSVLDEFAEVQSKISAAIEASVTSIESIAEGRFDKPITLELNGDFNRLKNGINQSMTQIKDTIGEIDTLVQGLREGDFSVSVDSKSTGEFQRMTRSMVSALKDIDQTLNGVKSVMADMTKGQFTSRINVNARGDLATIKDAVNETMTTIESAITDILSVVTAQSEGDLKAKITKNYDGQLAELKHALNHTTEKLEGVVTNALEAAATVAQDANEVSSGAVSLNQRVQEQAAALEETSATMDQMNAAVENNTANAKETALVVQDVQTRAQKGGEVMNQTISAMTNIQESSHKISDIVSLIDGIAFQTNLLALNAAVEAGRSGEHGRGFAVVAGEVRALAQKSAEAAKVIKGLIEESVKRVDDGTKLATESGSVLESIKDSIYSVTSMINQIATASQEQADGIRQVHMAINQIDGVTQQNAALVEETSAAAISLNEQASKLQTEMGFFNIELRHTALKQANKPKVLSHTKQETKPMLTKPASQGNQQDDWSEF
jgi:methyl-accepting chemotaxis protein